MRIIGFSTGALAKGEFDRALALLRKKSVVAVELSALRQPELWPLREAVRRLDLLQFSYVSVHAPSSIDDGSEAAVIEALTTFVERGWPVIVHPDAIGDFGAWRAFGDLLFVENMDNRKPTGRTVYELESVFAKLPRASFCLDLGHARQADPTMTEASAMLRHFGDRLRQLHLSEVNTASKHELLTRSVVLAFQKVAALIPENIPIILESPATEQDIDAEIEIARQALPSRETVAAEV